MRPDTRPDTRRRGPRRAALRLLPIAGLLGCQLALAGPAQARAGDLDPVFGAGGGPPLVLLHGYVGDGQTTWRRQLDDLSDDFTVVAWDAPGAGGSSDPPESFGTAGYADCLAAFVDRLALGRPHVAGLSFGGILVLAHRHPAVPATLVLAAA